MSMTPEENALINNKLNKLDSSISVLQNDMSRVLSYLDNDSKTGKPGLYQQNSSIRNDFDEFVAAYKIEKAYRKGVMVVLGIIGGAMFELILILIKALK